MADTCKASGGLLQQVHRLFRMGTVGGLTDGQLLDRFVSGRGEESEAAFEELGNPERHTKILVEPWR